jgi:TetR/AcrR family fatty acid metabolism transcriptional regulator
MPETNRPIKSTIPDQIDQGSDGKRLKILTAAEDVFSEKGFAEATISEIAREAGVTDSVIYRHFKGKEDLLFSIPEERMKESLSLLDRDQQGIVDVESKLRRLMWSYLWYHDVHPSYARILIFECRSSPDFYSTAAYRLIRKYAGRVSAILEQGARDGKFRSDVDMALVRDIVLGTLDTTTISFLAIGEIANALSDFEDMATLIHRMIAVRPEPKTARSDKASTILEAAERVFAEKGFNKAKVAEIARLAGVADGTVYEYFQSKEDLLFSIPMRRFEQYLNGISGVFEIKDPVRKLRRLIKYHFSTFLADRHFLKVFTLKLLLNMQFFTSKAFDAFRNYYRYVEDVIEEGKAKGVFRSDVNPRVFRNVFLGAFSHMVLRWLVLNRSSDMDVMKEINQLTDLLLDAVLAANAVDGSAT